MGFNVIGKDILDFDLMDEASSSVTYYGFADFNTSATSQAKFAIMRETVTGNVTIREWAGGSKAKNQIWDNRAALEYKLIQTS